MHLTTVCPSIIDGIDYRDIVQTWPLTLLYMELTVDYVKYICAVLPAFCACSCPKICQIEGALLTAEVHVSHHSTVSRF